MDWEDGQSRVKGAKSHQGIESRAKLLKRGPDTGTSASFTQAQSQHWHRVKQVMLWVGIITWGSAEPQGRR